MRRIALLGLLVSCHPPSEPISVPSNVAYVAWAVADDAGRITYTALVPVDEPRVFSVEGDTRAVLLGFDASVAGVVDRFGVEVASDPLEAKDGECGPRIADPTPLHAANGTSFEPGPLTAGWVREVCTRDRFLTDGVNCDVCVEPDCRGVEVRSSPVVVDPSYGIYSLHDVTWMDDTTLFARPGVDPDSAVARITYDPAPDELAVTMEIEPLSGVDRAQQLLWSDGSLWLVDGRRVHRATRDLEIVQSLRLSGRLAISGSPEGPALVHRVGGPAYELTETGTIARADLPGVIHALYGVGPDEVVAVGADELVWVRGAETYRHPLPPAYRSHANLADAGVTVVAAADRVVITGRVLPVFSHTRGVPAWLETPWPVTVDTDARDSAALAGGILVVGRADFGGLLMYVRDERACSIRPPVIAPINAVATAPRDGVAIAVTDARGVLPARLLEIRTP